MPSYNFLNKPADALGNDTDSSSMRGFTYWTRTMSNGGGGYFQFDFKPAYIAVCYSDNVKNAVLIYSKDGLNQNYNDWATTCWYADSDTSLTEINIGSYTATNPGVAGVDSCEFGISFIDESGFALLPAASMLPDTAEDFTMWYFALAEMPSKTSNTINGVLRGIDGDTTVDCGFVPDFLVILQSEAGANSGAWNYLTYWNKQRSSTNYLASRYSGIEDTSDTYNDGGFPFVNWTDTGFIFHGYDDDLVYFFAAKMPEEDA